MNLDIAGRGAFVVGATGDIGRATVRRLLEEGARVVAGGRSKERMTQKLAGEQGRLAGTTTIDLSDDESVARAVQRAEEVLGGIDILVCTAAGDVRYAPVWEITRDVFEKEYALKTVGTAQLSTQVAAHMKSRARGVIVNVIGIATDIVVTTNPAGSAANSALRSFTRVLAAEVAKNGVRVVGVSPGFVDGERLARFAGVQQSQISKTIPLGRLGSPAELADVITFLSSPRASYVTGAIVTVDGGATLR